MFDQFKAFTSDLSVLLVDKWLNTTTDLIAKPEYAFQISNDINSQGSGRFEIVVSNKSTVDVQDIIKGSASDFYVFKSPLDECVTFTAIGNGSKNTKIFSRQLHCPQMKSQGVFISPQLFLVKINQQRNLFFN